MGRLPAIRCEANRFLPVLFLLALPSSSPGAEEDVHAERRAALVEVVASQFRQLSGETGLDRLSEETRDALLAVERHRFVPDDAVHLAYRNRPLPIGHGQTISQPYIVALMTDLLDLQPGDRVLEIGTGSGYQAAVLAQRVDAVFSIEIIEPLHAQAARRFEDLGIDLSTRLGDGYHGWPEHAPFDAIIVTAAAGHVPPPLIEQLRPGGRLVIPVGSPFRTQMLMLLEKAPDGELSTRQILPVTFVPLTGDH